MGKVGRAFQRARFMIDPSSQNVEAINELSAFNSITNLITQEQFAPVSQAITIPIVDIVWMIIKY